MHWKLIEGCDNYWISKCGQVKNMKTGRKLNPWKTNYGYRAIELRKIKEKRTVYMVHRLVALQFIPNPENKPFIDHIDRNKKNNHISNLRWATHDENARNCKLSKNNTSGHKGVSWTKKRQKWVVQTRLYGRSKFHGYFDNLQDAIAKHKEVFVKF